MATTLEYALMAGAVYRDTRPDVNKLPIPSGWYLVSRNPQDNATGFEAATFGNGTTLATSTEIVISFAGTYDKDITGDIAADIGLGAGTGSMQLLQAADYYLQVKAANPSAHITLTGHSLGGGLAALIGVFFGETAVTFDQAPFAQTALFKAQSLMDYLAGEENAGGGKLYTASQLQSLTNFIAQQQANGGIPNSNLVSIIRVAGEFLSEAPLSALSPIGLPATVLNHGPTNVAGTDLHSIALLTAFLESNQSATIDKSLSNVTAKLPDLLEMLFDDKLFAYRTDTGLENFLDRLVRHQSGNAPGVTTGDAMLDRFTHDLWKLAQDGGLTLHDNNPGNADVHDLSDALVAFDMQFYYQGSKATDATKELFSTDGLAGGIRFDRQDVAASLADAKGYDLYFKPYLGSTNNYTAEEQALIAPLVPALRDWFVQAGAGGMTAADTQNRGDFMLRGANGDTLTGGDQTDLLIGNAGADTLRGDVLLGGIGSDTYVFAQGDGFDTVLDSDGLGVVKFGSIEAKGSTGLADAAKWKQLDTDTWIDTGNGIVYSKVMVKGAMQLLIHKGDSNALIQGWTSGGLGIDLGAGASIAEPTATQIYTGDQRAQLDPNGNYDWGATSWAVGGTLTGGVAEAGFNDVIYGSANADRIDGLGGNDALDGGAGDGWTNEPWRRAA